MAAPSEGIWDYGVLVDALASQRVDRGLSCADVDARAGFHEGFTNRLENWGESYGRGIGPASFGLWLEALGLALLVVPVDGGNVQRLAGSPRQLPLDLVGGHMNHARGRANAGPSRGLTLVDLAA